ncbi:MAG: aminotransferase class I/II-fold pyridoxal phosphate-dependent enzyme [Microthrixaceae bacterium]|nr:aminotransferase class I/II-fold pyridoxal phosphate-dependent enzyme [Microthrixaceae bacterium]
MSDNTAGVVPEVMEALAEAARGSAAPYGWDDYTAQARSAFDELFGQPVETLFCWGGTGGNVVGLATLVSPWHSIITADSAHVIVDECGAPARFTGATLTPVATDDGKLRTQDVAPFLQWSGNEHHPQPKVILVSQATETGLLYSVDELAALCDFAHSHEMVVYVDGARIANAVAALGCTVSELLVDTGVDAMTFGLTKNGAMYGEAVVFIDTALAANAHFVRKQAGQLASKGRYIAAQALALLKDDLWLTYATHSNAMAKRLADGVAGIGHVEMTLAPQVNGLFPRLPRPLITALQEWSLFFDWDEDDDVVRWMTSWETTTTDVDRFIAGLEYSVSRFDSAV